MYILSFVISTNTNFLIWESVISSIECCIIVEPLVSHSSSVLFYVLKIVIKHMQVMSLQSFIKTSDGDMKHTKNGPAEESSQQ